MVIIGKYQVFISKYCSFEVYLTFSCAVFCIFVKHYLIFRQENYYLWCCF